MIDSTVEVEDFRPTIELGLYRHYKGKFYRVLGVARHSETGGWFVVYQKQYDDFGLAIRPYAMFVEHILVDGVSLPRFRYTSDGIPEATDAGPDHYAGIFSRSVPDKG